MQTTRTIRNHKRAASGIRRRVAEAFRAMAHGVRDSSAYAHTVAFYRSGGQEWTKQLG
jgi:hypothetical protein